MIKRISFTSGSKPVLLNILNKHRGHKLGLYRSTTENTFVLIDWSNSESIFKLPMTFQIVKSSDRLITGSFINLVHFTLNNKQQKIIRACTQNLLTNGLPKHMHSCFLLKSVKNSSHIIFGSSWQSNQGYLTWIKRSFIHDFTENHFNNVFHNNLDQIR